MTRTVRSVEIELASGLLPIFFPLLQSGVAVEVKVGCTIKQLLTEQFGIAAEYLAERITTVFLDHKAVDDVGKAVVRDGSVLALSGAMPGLVGATMRTGGYYAAMRGAMTYHDDDKGSKAGNGRITLKLFNLLLEELGPRVLLRGILFSGASFIEFLNKQPADLRLRDYWLDGQPGNADLLQGYRELFGEETPVKLKVYPGGL